MSKLIIIRGPSGTGKSTIARHLGGVERENWFEADMYFMRNGHYEWVGSQLPAAHRWCQGKITAALQTGTDVIVSDTMPSRKDLKVYLDIAEAVGVDVQIVRSPRPWNVSDMKARTTHRVPTRILERHINRYVEHADEEEWVDMSIFKE